VAVDSPVGGWRCPDHGEIVPLWRPETAEYEAFAECLVEAGAFPTMLPWPMPPGWAITDFGCVAEPGGGGRASYLTCSGVSDLDGVVEVTLVAEEPGVGLGARCASVDRTDPGADIVGPPHVKVRLSGHPTPLWSVSTSASDVVFDRSVFASADGVANGGYVLVDASDGQPQVILIGTGSEVQLAVAAREVLEEGLAIRLSDHAPVEATFELPGGGSRASSPPRAVR